MRIFKCFNYIISFPPLFFNFNWLREMLKAVLDALFKHGADVRAFVPPNDCGLPDCSAILRNLKEGRELLDGSRRKKRASAGSPKRSNIRASLHSPTAAAPDWSSRCREKDRRQALGRKRLPPVFKCAGCIDLSR